MFAAALNFCLNVINDYSTRHLIESIELREKKYFLAALHSGKIDVNTPDELSKKTPLYYATHYNLPDFVFELLEWGAKIDTPQRGIKKTLLQICVDNHYLSLASLLVLYGASLTGIDYSLEKKTNETKDFLREKSETYQKISRLLQEPPTVETYQTLGKLWLQEAENEPNKELQACYLKKSNVFFKKYNQLLNENKTYSSSSSSLLFHEDSVNNSSETDLLIPQKNSSSSSSISRRKK